MQNKKLVELYQGLNSVKDLKGVKFAYGIVKNINIIKSEIEAFQESINPTKEFMAFENGRIELAKKHSKKDDKGNPVIADNQYEVEDKDKFEESFLELREKHKEAIDKREKQAEEYNKLLAEESKIELHKIKMSDVPDNISPEQLAAIFDIIDNDGY